MKKELGKIVKLFISKKDNKNRINKNEIKLDKYGVIDDKFHNKDINRSVLVTSLDSYNIAKNNKIDLSYGLLGENILIDFDIYSLDIGTKIYIADVILQISQNCTICNHLSIIHNDLPTLLKDDRGVFVKVLKDGIIKINDKIFISKVE